MKQESKSHHVQRAIRRVLISASGAVAVAAAPQLHAQDPTIQEVVVTGSRIPQPNLTSISPVTSIGAEAVKIEGVTRVEDLINNLPQAFADFGGNLSNGSTGTATVNLRNLGPQRTLVLVNSRRLMPGDPTQNGQASPDLNQIPAALIERVEVLSGGASAVYGADAVAGVVNFIMNDNFEGVRLDAQYSLYQHNNDSDVADIVRARNFKLPDSNVADGTTRDFTFVAGINTEDGRGNATVYLGYRQLEAIRQDARDFSACTLSSSDVEPSLFGCGGSGTPAVTRFRMSDGRDLTVNADGTLRPFAPTDQFNFAPDNYYQRPDERKTGGLFAHYDFSDKASVYTEFMFMDDRTRSQVAASGAFLGSGPGQPPFFGSRAINCDNPFLSPDMVQQFCGGNRNAPDVLINIGRRNVEGGGRLDDLRHTSFRGVVGLRGDIADGWNYDVYGLYGESVLAEAFQNDFSRERLGKALNAVTDNRPGSPTFGQVVCRVNADADLTNNDPACVPYDIFKASGGVTPEQLAYLQIPGLSEGETVEQVLSGSISADLGRYGLQLPTATDGVGIAFGAEYRSERSDLRTDRAYQTGDLAGQGAPTLNTSGFFDVRELFTEVRVPLVQGKPFAERLAFEAGYRYSDYNLGFSTDTYKLGLDWAPVEDVRFRGSYQRAVRSPNIQELFLKPRVQLNSNGDPCASAPGDAPEASLEECLRSGVTPGQYGNILANPASQYNGLVGGNSQLDPEESDTYSFGFVLTPRVLPGFSLTLDYFDVKVDKLIGSIGGDFILNSCLATGDPTFCSKVHRDANGSLWLGDTGYIEDPIINTGSSQAKGVDLEANYRFELGRAGSLALNAVGSWIEEFVTEPLDGALKYDCVGLYGTVCGTPIPEWRHKVRASWQTPVGVDLTLTWRFIDSVDLDATSSNPQLQNAVPFSDRKLGSRNYFDLVAAYTMSDVAMFSNVTGRLGINNVLDKDPPLIGQDSCPGVFCNGNTFPQVYDTLGRFVFLGLTADF